MNKTSNKIIMKSVLIQRVGIKSNKNKMNKTSNKIIMKSVLIQRVGIKSNNNEDGIRLAIK